MSGGTIFKEKRMEELRNRDEERIAQFEEEKREYGRFVGQNLRMEQRLDGRKRFYEEGVGEWQGEMLRTAEEIRENSAREPAAEETYKDRKKREKLRKKEREIIKEKMKVQVTAPWQENPEGEEEREVAEEEREMSEEERAVAEEARIEKMRSFVSDFSVPARMCETQWFLDNFDTLHSSYQNVDDFLNMLQENDEEKTDLWERIVDNKTSDIGKELDTLNEYVAFTQKLQSFKKIYLEMRASFGISDEGREAVLTEEERRAKISNARAAQREYGDQQEYYRRMILDEEGQRRETLREEIAGREKTQEALQAGGVSGMGVELLEPEEIKAFAYYRGLTEHLIGSGAAEADKHYSNLIQQLYGRMHYCSMKLGEIRLDMRLFNDRLKAVKGTKKVDDFSWIQEDVEQAKQANILYKAEIQAIQETLSYMANETDTLSRNASEWLNASVSEDMVKRVKNTHNPVWNMMDQSLLEMEPVPDTTYTILDALYEIADMLRTRLEDEDPAEAAEALEKKEKFFREYAEKKEKGEAATIFDMFKELRGKDIMTLIQEGLEEAMRQRTYEYKLEKGFTILLHSDDDGKRKAIYDTMSQEKTSKAKEGDRDAGEFLEDLTRLNAMVRESPTVLRMSFINDFMSLLSRVLSRKDVQKSGSGLTEVENELIKEAVQWSSLAWDEILKTGHDEALIELCSFRFRHELYEYKSEESKEKDSKAIRRAVDAKKGMKERSVLGVEGQIEVTSGTAELLEGIDREDYGDEEWDNILYLAERIDDMMARKEVYNEIKQEWNKGVMKVSEELKEELSLFEKRKKRQSALLTKYNSITRRISALERQEKRTGEEENELAILQNQKPLAEAELEADKLEFKWTEENARIEGLKKRTLEKYLPEIVKESADKDRLKGHLDVFIAGAEAGIQYEFDKLHAALAKKKQA